MKKIHIYDSLLVLSILLTYLIWTLKSKIRHYILTFHCYAVNTHEIHFNISSYWCLSVKHYLYSIRWLAKEWNSRVQVQWVVTAEQKGWGRMSGDLLRLIWLLLVFPVEILRTRKFLKMNIYLASLEA